MERLQVLKVNGCDKLGDSSLLALCARTWRLYNPRRDKHPVPLRFFDSFLPDTFKASGAVSVQVLVWIWREPGGLRRYRVPEDGVVF